MVSPRDPVGPGGGGRDPGAKDQGRGHQPPNPADLAAFPPAGSACERIRQLLRDFVDGDLGDEAAVEVEVHVHECRSCAVALARGESEALQLRRAFGGLDQQDPGPGPEFTESVLSQVGWVASPGAEMQPPPDFTAGVIRLVEAELRESEPSQPDASGDEPTTAAGNRAAQRPRRWPRPLHWAGVAAAVVVCAGLAQVLWGGAAPRLGKVLRAEQTDGVATWVLELDPTADGPSYDKIIAWISKADSIVRRVDYYQDGGTKPYKRLVANDVRDVSGKKIPFTMTMTNPRPTCRKRTIINGN